MPSLSWWESSLPTDLEYIHINNHQSNFISNPKFYWTVLDLRQSAVTPPLSAHLEWKIRLSGLKNATCEVSCQPSPAGYSADVIEQLHVEDFLLQ